MSKSKVWNTATGATNEAGVSVSDRCFEVKGPSCVRAGHVVCEVIDWQGIDSSDNVAVTLSQAREWMDLPFKPSTAWQRRAAVEILDRCGEGR